jgi:BCD family chlorophyll transporter-like MFS transporter
MIRVEALVVRGWSALSPRFLPFADAASVELPLGRLTRLALFQVSVAMATVLLNGTLNRVMIVELGVPSSLVALMVALPLVFAPLRTLIGHRSDTHRSVLGWRRVPYIWIGTLLQFGGLAIMPFALLVLSGDTRGTVPPLAGHLGAGLAFLLVGAGLHTTQTAGLALATDLAPRHTRPRVVAFLYVMLLAGMMASALIFGALLAQFSQLRLIQVIQGAAVLTLILNVVALWKQEARQPALTAPGRQRPTLAQSWAEFRADPRAVRMLVAVGLGTMAFSMQDILLEPYGAEVLHLSVGATTLLTALFAGGSLIGLTVAAGALGRGRDPNRLAAFGVLAGLAGFSALIFAAPLESVSLFRCGALLLGTGAGLFSVGTLTAAMDLAESGRSGFALGAWGAVQATAAGGAIALGGFIRDVVGRLSASGALGEALTGPNVAYSAVYHVEIVLLFATLIAIGPLVRSAHASASAAPGRFGLAAVPS